MYVLVTVPVEGTESRQRSEADFAEKSGSDLHSNEDELLDMVCTEGKVGLHGASVAVSLYFFQLLFLLKLLCDSPFDVSLVPLDE